MKPSSGWAAAAAGLAAVLAGLGLAELAAALFAPGASPLYVVGAAVIDLVPGWVKDGVVALFGTGDKAFLLTVLGVVVGVLAALAGWAERRWAWSGRGAFLLGGCLGAWAAVTRAAATPASAAPSLVAGVGAAIALALLLGALGRIPQPVAARVPPSPHAVAVARRTFIGWTAASAVLGVLAVAGGRMLSAATTAATAARTALRLPRPATTLPPVPAGASLDVPGITPLVTAAGDFYRIDTALQVPHLDPKDWSLEVTGMVEHPFTLHWDELLALPLEESWTTLVCVSNEVGGNLISNARWLGYPVRLLLERAGVKAGADMVFSTSHDGWTASTPLTAMTDAGRAAIVAVGMNGQPLPFEHGFPARVVVPGLYGYVSATKWVVKLEVTRFVDHTAYWTERGWSDHGPVKLSSRIDVPANGRTVPAGELVVAGVAWHQHVGISAVEVQLDQGPWQRAQLADALDTDTWRQWRLPLTGVPRGDHQLRVRAIDAGGAVQTAKLQDVVPDGATGLHQIAVHLS